jgi:uncharacterized protein DUF6916
MTHDPATYRRQIGTIFSIDGPDKVDLRLATVTDERVSGNTQQFSLFFHGPANRVVPQGTYSLRHDELGLLLLFIVPVVGSNEERIVYEACFTVPVHSTQPPAAS